MALEFAVDVEKGVERIFERFEEACACAVRLAASRGEAVNLDVLAYSEDDAREWSGDDGVESYREDVDASVFERIVIRADAQGRVA